MTTIWVEIDNVLYYLQVHKCASKRVVFIKGDTYTTMLQQYGHSHIQLNTHCGYENNMLAL